MQLVIVYAAVSAAVLYTAYRLWRMFRKKDGGVGCSRCGCCGGRKQGAKPLDGRGGRNADAAWCGDVSRRRMRRNAK